MGLRAVTQPLNLSADLLGILETWYIDNAPFLEGQKSLQLFHCSL